MRTIPINEIVTYDQFVTTKLRAAQVNGFDLILPLNENLFEWQKLVATWAVKQGRCAIFADCGLGKTLLSLEWAKQVCAKTNKPVLILAPLSVADQTVQEGLKFGIEVSHVREPHQMHATGIYITNYDRVEKFAAIIENLGGIVLDESSILKAFSGKTRIVLTELFRLTDYRLCCSATPSPNDFTELGQQAEFLGVCSSMEMLAQWFINDTANTGTWRLKKHSVEAFWKWVSSWAACISKPSDLGFDNEGYDLPELKIEPIWVDVDETIQAGETGELFRSTVMSSGNINREMRLTIKERCGKVAEIIKSGNSVEQFSVWCNLNDEQDMLEDLLEDHCVSVRGADSEEKKIEREKKWRNDELQVMVSKGSIFGFGMNWQHCHNLIVFPTFSFEDIYQIIKRFHRFGQKHTVNCYVVLPRTAGNVLKIIREKWAKHETMRDAMRFSAETILHSERTILMKTDITKRQGKNWTLYHGDCVRVAGCLLDNSIGFSVFSPPFADLFVYSADVQDMGNCKTMEQFKEQFQFLVKELYRITAPGRLCAVHCCDLMATKWKDGAIELKNFSGELIDMFCGNDDTYCERCDSKSCNCEWISRSGGDWLFHTRITIWKDPVVEMQRTKALGLLHKQLLKDSAMSRVGSPEYILVFRKPGVNENPISHERDDYPVELWQRDASPVWMDINQTRVLNGHIARDSKDERHICPLQLDVIERCLRLWSAPNDLVFSPFTGIGSEGFCAISMGRKFVGSELKESYFNLAESNLKKAEDETRTLFNTIVPKPLIKPPTKKKVEV